MKRTIIYCIFLFVLFVFWTIGEFCASTAREGSSFLEKHLQNKEYHTWCNDSIKFNNNQKNLPDDWQHFFAKQTYKSFVDKSFFFNITSQEETIKLKMSILGDSYSTYKGYVSPDTNECWYADTMEYKNNLHDVKQTWWWIIKEDMGWTLEKNNSFSGATICNTGYKGRDFSKRSFVTRMDNIGEPDILFIFGGTNDCWAGSPLGEFEYEEWTAEDLYNFRPAFAYIINHLKRTHPQMRIINICNSDLRGKYNASMEAICTYYQIENIQLKSIDKQHSHPSVVGMREIVEQIETLLNDARTDLPPKTLINRKASYMDKI